MQTEISTHHLGLVQLIRMGISIEPKWVRDNNNHTNLFNLIFFFLKAGTSSGHWRAHVPVSRLAGAVIAQVSNSLFRSFFYRRFIEGMQLG